MQEMLTRGLCLIIFTYLRENLSSPPDQPSWEFPYGEANLFISARLQQKLHEVSVVSCTYYSQARDGLHFHDGEMTDILGYNKNINKRNRDQKEELNS